MSSSQFLPHERLGALFDALLAEGFRVLGPTVEEGAVRYRPMSGPARLPWGFVQHQAPGESRLDAQGSPRCFDWSNGPDALKPLLFPPQEAIWEARRGPDGRLGFQPVGVDPPERPLAVLGVRACDLAALELLDRHFLAAGDSQYQARRTHLFLIGVDCHQPCRTCFCASTGDGPAVRSGADLRLAELDDGFVAWAGSARGEALLAGLGLATADEAQIETAAALAEQAARAQTHGLPAPEELREVLPGAGEHHRWRQIAVRCLACGSCTAVCPTCFCHALHSDAALDGATATQVRAWDSCFTPGHSSLHGHPVRAEVRHRYRQWMTHKLAGWQEQYGRIGCVGCGRCTAWCPVGIDFAREATLIVEGDA